MFRRSVQVRADSTNPGPIPRVECRRAQSVLGGKLGGAWERREKTATGVQGRAGQDGGGVMGNGMKGQLSVDEGAGEGLR